MPELCFGTGQQLGSCEGCLQEGHEESMFVTGRGCSLQSSCSLTECSGTHCK